MRLLSNAVPYPVGTVSSAPQWHRVFENVTPEAGSIQTFQNLNTDGTYNRVVIGTNPVGVTTNIAVIPLGSQMNPSPTGEGLWAESYDYNGQPYFSNIDNRIIVGSGTVSLGNKEISQRTSWELDDLIHPDAEHYSHSNAEFPSCKTFVLGPDKAVYATGNDTDPLYVWVSEPRDMLGGGLNGIESGVMSAVGIPDTGATKVTALSTFQDFVVCHTDAGVVLLRRPADQQAATGWRVEQLSTPINAGAYSPNTVSPSLGSAPYYLGTDGQIYRNQVEQPSTDEQLQARTREIASFQAVGQWDADIKNLEYAFSTYDTSGNWFIAGINSDGRDIANGHGWYMLSGDTNAISGPHWYPRFTCIQAIPGSSHLLGVDGDGQFWTTDLRDIREKRDMSPEFVVTDTDGPSVTVYESRLTASVLGTDQNHALATANGETLMLNDPFQAEFVPEVGGALNHHFPSSMAERNDVAANITGTSYDNSMLSVIETAFEDFQSPESTKHFMELVLKFDGGSVGHMGAFVETEDGNADGAWLGDIEGKDTHKVFINIRGRKLRVRIYVATDVAARWVLNDVTVGFTQMHTL